MTKETSHKKVWSWLWLSALIIVLDQITKYWAVRHLADGVPDKIFSFFNLYLSFNAGASFGFLNRTNGSQVYLFALISLIVVVFLLVWLARIKRKDVLMAAGMSLIIGGAIGNFIDRVRLKFVIDFFDFHLRNWHFATFNVADSAVCVGAILIILRLIFSAKK